MNDLCWRRFERHVAIGTWQKNNLKKENKRSRTFKRDSYTPPKSALS
jgi:hypothetical protein